MGCLCHTVSGSATWSMGAVPSGEGSVWEQYSVLGGGVVVVGVWVGWALGWYV